MSRNQGVVQSDNREYNEVPPGKLLDAYPVQWYAIAYGDDQGRITSGMVCLWGGKFYMMPTGRAMVDGAGLVQGALVDQLKAKFEVKEKSAASSVPQRLMVSELQPSDIPTSGI